jgi:hypothetical protein
MAHAVTTPAEWRRRAGTEPSLPAPPDDDSSELARLVAAGWDSLDDTAAAEVRAIVWDQPIEMPAVRIGPDQYVHAHVGRQPFAVLGWATAFLVEHFETTGDDDDLAAATELHDLTVALGDDVWDWPENAPVALGAARLYNVTGEVAFLATVERLADMLCEAQPLTDGNAAILAAIADLVESRQPLEVEVEAESRDE